MTRGKAFSHALADLSTSSIQVGHHLEVPILFPPPFLDKLFLVSINLGCSTAQYSPSSKTHLSSLVFIFDDCERSPFPFRRMADPVSVAGLAVSVVSLGIQVSGGITTYIDSLSCRDKDIASIRQQNASLQKSLEVIEASLPQFHRKHHPATTAVHECLDSSKNELSTLESLISDLTSCDQFAKSRKDKFKSQGKRLLYPFSRPKVKELETRICNTNSALQLALQTLGLFVDPI